MGDRSKKKGRDAKGAARGSSQARQQRAVRRCPFVAGAEVTDLASEARISARTSELGIGGCYVDTLNPFPQGTRVRVRILKDQGVFETEAKVAYAHSNSGMGLAFINPAPQQRRLLEDWLAEVVLQFRSAS